MNPASSCGHLQILEHHGDFCLGFLLQKLHQLTHFRVYALAQTQREDVPPLADIRLHDDVCRRGVGQDLSRILRLQPFLQQEVIRLFRIGHAEFPEFGGFVAFTIEARQNEGDFIVHADIALRLDAEARQSVTGKLRHNVAGGEQLHAHIREFQRRKMSAPNQRAHERRRAVIGDLVMGAITVAPGVFDLSERVQTSFRSLQFRRLLNDLHFLPLLRECRWFSPECVQRWCGASARSQ